MINPLSTAYDAFTRRRTGLFSRAPCSSIKWTVSHDSVVYGGRARGSFYKEMDLLTDCLTDAFSDLSLLLVYTEYEHNILYIV